MIAACAALGALNGVLVARLTLPSLAVTLGTMGAFRGLAFILGSETGYTDFDDSYLYVGSEQAVRRRAHIVHSLPCRSRSRSAFSCGWTVFGRRCYAVGLNKEAVWAAGIDVARIKIEAYTLAGALAGVAALVWIGQYGSARGDNADGAILFVVTAVVLGGLDINGGRGAILGVVLALFLLGTMRNGMGLANIGGPTQTIVLGALLIVGVLRPMLFRGVAGGYQACVLSTGGWRLELEEGRADVKVIEQTNSRTRRANSRNMTKEEKR